MAHPKTAILKALGRAQGRNEAMLRPPRSRLEQASIRRALRWSFEAFNRRELDAVLALLPSNFEWEILPEFPGAGVFRGHEEVRRFFEEFLSDFPDYNTHIEDYSDDGRRITIRVHAFNPAPHTGLELNIRFVQTWDYEDGVHRIRERLTESDSGISELMSSPTGVGRERAGPPR